MRSELGNEYVDLLRALYDDRLPHFSDLCCFWFERSRAQVAQRKCERAGLLATQAIRGGANRVTLDRVKESGDIFFAESDRGWVLDGATVHVSMVGFDDGTEYDRHLDGECAAKIHADLSSACDTTRAVRLASSAGLSFIGVQKSGSFDVPIADALLLAGSTSVRGVPGSDVLRPYLTARDVVQRSQRTWIIDFTGLTEAEAAAYQEPFERVRGTIPEERTAKHFNKYPSWLFWRPRQEMYDAVAGLSRYIVTPLVSKHRIFAWTDTVGVPSNLLVVIARDDDTFLGLLHSHIHEVWARRLGTQLREAKSGARYTPTTCFETFPFPWPPGEEPTDDERVKRIAAAAKELDELRTNWLNPPEWTREEILEFPGSTDGPWARYVHDPDDRGIGTVKYPRIVAKDEPSAKLLKKRTLTNLYNERPTWLDLAHRKLDEAVFTAYDLPPDLTNEAILEKLLEMNLARAGDQ